MSGTLRHSPGRRRFVQLLGWAGVATMARGGPALAQAASRSRGVSSKPDSASAPPPSPAAPPASAPVPTGPSAEALALAEVARQRYGAQLSAEELATIAKDLDGDLAGIKRLREAKLANADEPDLTFHA